MAGGDIASGFLYAQNCEVSGNANEIKGVRLLDLLVM
jgi:hypothetical protein